jgi:transglutaminase-like putative cysteine protease
MSLKLLDVPMARYTDRTIEEMHKLIKKAKTDEKFRELALWLTRDGDRDRDWKNYIAELENAFNRLRKVVTYRRDPYQVEWVQNAWHTLRMKAGDCDDLSVLICSVMGATGAQYRFVTLKADRLRPDEFSHIFPEIQVPGKGWVAADLSVSEPLGYRPSGFPEKIWNEPVY